ncbi:sugar phosphate nucleotidyltransferase [Aerosakkonema funiforme]|uniref:sugar phosphate nucleotidyltransferase n=1 Tax=Aerosakkonema funiforme TaxID=1246630 RepID=UPI0035B71098
MKPTRAVIPLAGLASRLYPATKVIPKALLPIPGRDGSLRPAVDWIVREALASGVEEVVLIVSPRDGELIRSYFDEPPPGILEGAAGKRIYNAWNELQPLSQHLRYVYQLEPGGFGDAVLQCREVVGDEPFVLLLGDHLYQSSSPVPCVRQVLEMGTQFGKGILGVTRRDESEIGQYGVVGVRLLPNQSSVFELTDMREKPSVSEARASLRIPGSQENKYICLFGIYLLPGHFMKYLQAAREQERGELDLSDALRCWIYTDGGFAYEVEGDFLDIGTPKNYCDTVDRFPQ